MSNAYQGLPINIYLLWFLFIWELLWKGLSLWNSAKNNQRNWFVALLILHTLGILEIIYLFFFAKKKMTVEELKFWQYFQNKARR